MKIGYIGLGRMGKNMVLHLLEKGIEIVAWNRSKEPLAELANTGAVAARDLTDLAKKLQTPRIIWLMLPSGQVIDEFIAKLSSLLSIGDLIIDGGNSFYKDSIRRGENLAKKGIHFMDIGTSGGPAGARTGACLMVGGDRKDFETILPLVKAASAPNAYGYFGRIGAGHFTKMVHNGIEYGMMESIAEGAAILEKSEFDLDLAEVFRVYNSRSVIESRLVGWTQEALKEDPKLKNVSSEIGYTGEGEWTVKTAKNLKVDVPAIGAALNVRIDSKNQADNFRNKVVSAMRGKFGQHKVSKD